MVDGGCCNPASSSRWPIHLHYPRRKNSFVFLQFLFFCRNIADPEGGLVAPFFSWLGLRPKSLLVWRAASVCRDPTELPAPVAAACCQQDSALPSQGEPGRLLPNSSLFDSLKLAYRQLLSLFTAFTLVQLRSLLRSKCWQAIFINHVRLNVFKCMYLRKTNHALVLFLFSSRPWGFFALFSLAYSVWCKGFSSVWKLVF